MSPENGVRRRIRREIRLSEYIARETGQRGRTGEGGIVAFPCPFHNRGDSGFSLVVDDREGLWYCDVCRAGGDIVDFACRLHGLSEGEALRRLIRIAGDKTQVSGGGVFRMKRREKFLGIVLIIMMFAITVIFGFGNVGGCGQNKKTWYDVAKISKQLDERGKRLAEVLGRKER